MLSAPQNSPAATLLSANLAQVRARIAAAAASCGRDVRSITLLAVSKGHDAGRLRAAHALGLDCFGENYVGEALPKIQALADLPITWHFTGRLQGNTTRPVAQHFDWVHGLDRVRIAERLSAQRGHHAPPLNVCVQVNIADEASKGGVDPQELPALLAAVAAMPRLALRGLMCMLPHDAPPALQHQRFGEMRRLLEAANAAGHPLDTLSMGMSDDMEAAICEGATLVRIGTALFGPRD